MDTVSETVVIGSAMIGHNPDTPGGEGLALGLTVPIERLAGHTEEVVAIIDDCPYYRGAVRILSCFPINLSNTWRCLCTLIIYSFSYVLLRLTW